MQKETYGKLSMSQLKLIACITMLIDHIACVIGWEGHSLIPFETSWMRETGRIAFPLFAFALVEGWRYTSDKTAYICRMAIFACVSQIPYVLALDEVNIVGEFTGDTYIRLTDNWKYWAGIFGLLLILCILDTKKARKSYVLIGLACVLCGVFWKMQGLWICNPTRNIGYLLLAGLLLFRMIDGMTEICRTLTEKSSETKRMEKVQITKHILIVLLTAMLVLKLTVNTGYDFGGLLLLLLLYVFRNYRYLQIIAGIVWSVIFYGVIHWNYTYAGFAAGAFMLLIFYSGQKGKICRKAFYWFYPIHLLLLGCINVFYVLK